MIAVTGATGLLGSFVVRKLVSEGIPVTALRRKDSSIKILEDIAEKIIWREADVLDPLLLTESLKGVTTVIHSAALVSFNKQKSKTIFEVNVTGTRNVVDVCLTLGIKKLIHVSSVAALGRQKGMTLLNEESKWIDSLQHSDYSESKYDAELEVFRGHEEGLNVSIVNPSVILAPADWDRSCSQIFKYLWKEKPFYTEGLMNYVDARDVAELIYKLTQTDFNGEKFIANAGSIALKDLFGEISKRFGKKTPHIKVNPWLISLASTLENIRCLLTGKEPIITRQTVRFAKEPFSYDNTKASDLLHIKFRSLAETLDWCCPYYAREVTINK